VVFESNILAAMSNMMELKEEEKLQEKKDPKLILEEARRRLERLHQLLDRTITEKKALAGRSI